MSGRRAIMVAAALGVGATLAAGAMAGSQAPTAGPTYKQVGKFGKGGTGNGQFLANAYGLATAKNGDVFVADTDNHRIQRFSASGAFKGKISFGGLVVAPDVAIDADGNVWGTTGTQVEARQFTPDGRPLATVTTARQALGIGADAAGNIYIATDSDNVARVTRYEKAGGAYAERKSWGGFQAVHDVEVSLDGTVWVSDNRALNVKRFDANGKLLKTMKAGPSAPVGVGVDLDCNVWVGDISQRRIAKYSPSGKLLATAVSPDLIAQDIAVGPKGDVYAYDVSSKAVIRFAEDKSKPATANVPGAVKVSKGVAKISYTLSGVACPAVVGATATVSGSGISGKAAGLKLKAGAKNVITMKFSKAASGKATFTIVLKTNGRPTTETRSVTVSGR
ncbi:MAG: NHL repeat-containing protein [Gaiellaceae bacterium]